MAGDAAQRLPRARRRRLAARGRRADQGRARHRQRRARRAQHVRRPRATGSGWTGAGRSSRSSRTCSCTSRPESSRPRATRRAGRRSSTSSTTRVRVVPVGRLDVDTTGALLLTNDGELAHRLAHPRYGVEKVYVADGRRRPGRRDAPAPRARASSSRTADGAGRGRNGSAPGRVELVLHEGRNRQVKRMLEAVGHPVSGCTASRYAGPRPRRASRPGEWRELTRARGRGPPRRHCEGRAPRPLTASGACGRVDFRRRPKAAPHGADRRASTATDLAELVRDDPELQAEAARRTSWRRWSASRGRWRATTGSTGSLGRLARALDPRRDRRDDADRARPRTVRRSRTSSSPSGPARSARSPASWLPVSSGRLGPHEAHPVVDRRERRRRRLARLVGALREQRRSSAGSPRSSRVARLDRASSSTTASATSVLNAP